MSLNDLNLGTSSGGASGFRASSPSEEEDAIVRGNDDIPAGLRPIDLERGAGLQAALTEERDGLQFSDFESGAAELQTSSPREEDKAVQEDSSFQPSVRERELRSRSEISVRPKVRGRPEMIVRPEVREGSEASFRPIVPEGGEMSCRPAVRERRETGGRPEFREKREMSFRQEVESSEESFRPRVRERSDGGWPKEVILPESTAKAFCLLQNLLTGPLATNNNYEVAVRKRRPRFSNCLPTILDEEELALSVEDTVKELKPLSISCDQEEVVPFSYGSDQEQPASNNNVIQESLALSMNWGIQQQVAQAVNSIIGEQLLPSSNKGDQHLVQHGNSGTAGSLALGSEVGGEDQISPLNDGDIVGDSRPLPDQEDSNVAEYQEDLEDYLSDVEGHFSYLFYEDEGDH